MSDNPPRDPPELQQLNHNFAEVFRNAAKEAAFGANIYQKCTCSKCGARLGIEKPNIFYTAIHCEICDHITDVVATGCNYMVEINNRKPVTPNKLTLAIVDIEKERKRKDGK